MRQKLTLSRETLRALDEQDLALVVGGSGSKDDKKKGEKKHGNKSGFAKVKFSNCPGSGSWSE